MTIKVQDLSNVSYFVVDQAELHFNKRIKLIDILKTLPF